MPTASFPFDPDADFRRRIFGDFTTLSMPSQKQQFNQGDKVVLLDVGDYSNHSSLQWDKSHVWGVVIGTDSGGEVYIDWPNGNRTSYYPHKCTLALLSDVQATVKNRVIDLTQLERLVLAEEAKQEIVAVLKQHQFMQQIFEEWGLGETIEYGKGMTFLFHGPPGVGKTWAGHCIAKAFSTELLIISPAEIHSSVPGEANRNLQEAFKEATRTGKVLLLDECDGLVADRAHLGMILGGEINTLLTEIEKYEGIVILATNRIGSLDPALERRISLILEFPEPNHEQRMLIWQKMLPKKLPLDKNVTVEGLAEYKLTGGQIKNVLLGAARLAVADDATTVTMTHFERAIARVQKSRNLMGKQQAWHPEEVGVHGRKEVERSMHKIAEEV